MTSNKHARFCFNNWVESGSFSTSSAESSYPAANLVSGIRSKVWQAAGLFEITAANNKVYINGSTYTVPVGTYLVAALITAFNTATSTTLSRNSLGRFVITLGGAGTLNLATTTDSIWSTLGFLGTSDLSGTAFTADERRYNTSEWIKVDLGIPQVAQFSCLIPPSETVFSSPTAAIYLQGDNVDDWTSPAVNLPMEVSSVGAFVAPDITTQPCRYWRIQIVDVKNSSISAAVAYIGDAVISSNTNVATGFTRTRTDQSQRLYSEGGQLYVNRKPRLLTISGSGVQFLKGQDLIDMEQLIFDLGTGRPFFLCLDPTKAVSTSLGQMTHYVEVDGEASLSHVLNSYYNLSLNFREVL